MNRCAVGGKRVFSVQLEPKSLVAAGLEENLKNRRGQEGMSLYSSEWARQKRICPCEMSNKHAGSLDLIISQSHMCY